MFASLNRFISRLDSDPNERPGLTSDSSGFQCLRNKNPEIPIEPWFDFIVGINGRQIVCFQCYVYSLTDSSRKARIQFCLQRRYATALVEL